MPSLKPLSSGKPLTQLWWSVITAPTAISRLSLTRGASGARQELVNFWCLASTFMCLMFYGRWRSAMSFKQWWCRSCFFREEWALARRVRGSVFPKARLGASKRVLGRGVPVLAKNWPPEIGKDGNPQKRTNTLTTLSSLMKELSHPPWLVRFSWLSSEEKASPH